MVIIDVFGIFVIVEINGEIVMEYNLIFFVEIDGWL